MSNTEHMSASDFKKFNSYDEIKAAYLSKNDTKAKPKQHHTDHEHKLQSSCYGWFVEHYPGLYRLLFAIPNGGHRNIAVAKKLAAEGVVKGVADLFLSIPSCGSHGLYIEMKTLERGSHQQPEQKDFEAKVTAQGYLYRIVRSKEEFEDLIYSYLNGTIT